MDRDLSTSPLGDLSVSRAESQSAVAWGAILAGATASLALSMMLLGLAAGFGLKLATPWPGARHALLEFTPILGSCMIVVQVLSSALGGYLAGRLRTKWLNVHDHEVHFRDTAHGLLVWAVSTVAGVVLVATVLAPPTPSAGLALLTAREVSLDSQLSLFMGLGLLMGAFIASVAAALGGLRRDEMYSTYWKAPARA